MSGETIKFSIEKINLEQKPLLAEMLKVMKHRENEADYVFPYLDDYWTDEDHIPYFITVNGGAACGSGAAYGSEVAGFVLLDKYFWVMPQAKNNYGVAEIYVKPEFRRRGIARNVMFLIFEMYPGNWEIRPLDGSPAAQAFWEHTIGAYTKENYKTTCFGKYKRPIYTLEAPVIHETGHEIVYREAYIG
jgi:predicted acetyltransferase